MNLHNDTKQERKHKGHFARYRQIVMVLAKYRLEEVLRYVGLQKYLAFRLAAPRQSLAQNGLYQAGAYAHGDRGVGNIFRETGTNPFDPR